MPLTQRSSQKRLPSDSSEAAQHWEYITRAQAGDIEAFAELYRLYHRRVYAYIFRLLPHVETAQDLTSETFLKAFESLHTVKWKGYSPRTWLFRIAFNKTIDHLRWRNVQYEWIDEYVCNLLGNDSVEELAEHHFQTSAIIEAIKGLTQGQQRCVFLRYVVGLRLEETGRVLGLTKRNVAWHQAQAIKALRAQGLPLRKKIRNE